MRETPKALQAWLDYLALGPDRSLEKLLALYQNRVQTDHEASTPTLRLASLGLWSRTFGWQARLEEITEREIREAEERQAEYVRDILETGYALPHERVALLKSLIPPLVEDVTTGGKRWVKDVKQIGSGEGAERVDLERFNAPEFDEIRALIDDIAKETGGRVKKTEVTGKDGKPLQVAVSWAEALQGLWQHGRPDS